MAKDYRGARFQLVDVNDQRCGFVYPHSLMNDSIIEAVWKKYPDIKEVYPGWIFFRQDP